MPRNIKQRVYCSYSAVNHGICMFPLSCQTLNKVSALCQHTPQVLTSATQIELRPTLHAETEIHKWCSRKHNRNNVSFEVDSQNNEQSAHYRIFQKKKHT